MIRYPKTNQSSTVSCRISKKSKKSCLPQCNQAVKVTKAAILDKIIVDVPYNSFLFYKNWQLYRTKITNRHIDTINLQLLDDQGNDIVLNGSNWSCTIQIDYIHRKALAPV